MLGVLEFSCVSNIAYSHIHILTISHSHFLYLILSYSHSLTLILCIVSYFWRGSLRGDFRPHHQLVLNCALSSLCILYYNYYTILTILYSLTYILMRSYHMLVCAHKCLSEAIWSYLDLSRAVWSYLELSGAIYLELSGTIWSYLKL